MTQHEIGDLVQLNENACFYDIHHGKYQFKQNDLFIVTEIQDQQTIVYSIDQRAYFQFGKLIFTARTPTLFTKK